MFGGAKSVKSKPETNPQSSSTTLKVVRGPNTLKLKPGANPKSFKHEAERSSRSARNLEVQTRDAKSFKDDPEGLQGRRKPKIKARDEP